MIPYERWKETYEKILDMYIEIPNAPEFSECRKHLQDVQDAWENLNEEYSVKWREELWEKMGKGLNELSQKLRNAAKKIKGDK